MMGEKKPSLKKQWSVVYFFKISEMFRNKFTSPVMFILHFIKVLGKPVLKEENTMSQTLFSLYMLMSSNLKTYFIKSFLCTHLKTLLHYPILLLSLLWTGWMSFCLPYLDLLGYSLKMDLTFFEFLNIWQCMDCADKDMVLGSW